MHPVRTAEIGRATRPALYDFAGDPDAQKSRWARKHPLRAGAIPAGSRWLAEAGLHYERYDALGLSVIAHAYESAVACAVGDRDAARIALERCRGAVRSEPPPRNQLPHLRWAEASAAVAEREPERGWRILLDAAERLESIGAARYACEAAADAARSFLAEGQEASARRAATHSRRLFAAGEGSLPPIDGLAATAPVLSAREAELAELASRG